MLPVLAGQRAFNASRTSVGDRRGTHRIESGDDRWALPLQGATSTGRASLAAGPAAFKSSEQVSTNRAGNGRAILAIPEQRACDFAEIASASRAL